MTTLDLITALFVAAARHDLAATAQLLAQLEQRLPPEELIPLCAQLPAPPQPAAQTTAPLRCA